MKKLTPQQSKIYSFIESHILDNGVSPTYREIQKAFSFASLSSVHDHIKALEKKGVIATHKYAPRSLYLTGQKSHHPLYIPIIGTVSGTAPLSLSLTSTNLPLPTLFVPRPEITYALRVAGDSFKEELIGDGDLLIVEARPDFDDGEEVLLTVQKQWPMIKHISRSGESLVLAGRSDRDAIKIAPETITVQGVVIALLRSDLFTN